MITYHENVVQGSEEWAAMRCGLLTASEMSLIITPTLKAASNDKERAHLYELLGQRITGYVEPRYVGDDMLRGIDDEILAVDLYSKNYAPVQTVGFVTNDKWGFTIGYSPDVLVGDDGLVECKSRRQKYQVQTILEGCVPSEFVIQCQTGLLVTERKWLDFISYSGGLPMFVVRCLPIPEIQDAILEAATAFEIRLKIALEKYNALHDVSDVRLIATERRIIQEMYA
jgi:hypothetical protein